MEVEIFGKSAREARRFYSVEDSAAQSVIERVQQLLPGARLRCEAQDGMFRCEWRSGTAVLGSATANRPALAVCAASLEACRSGAALAPGQLFRRSAPVWTPAVSARSSAGAPSR